MTTPTTTATLRSDYEHSICAHCGQAIERFPSNQNRWASAKDGDVCFSPKAHMLFRLHVAR